VGFSVREDIGTGVAELVCDIGIGGRGVSVVLVVVDEGVVEAYRRWRIAKR